MAIPSIPAYVGYTGFAKIGSDGLTSQMLGVQSGTYFGLRLTSADLRLRQAVDALELITGKYDKTVYKLGPFEIDGGMQFPAILEAGNDNNTNPVEKTWLLAIKRQLLNADEPSAGRLYDFKTGLKYYAGANQNALATFLFDGCQINSWEFSVTQGDVANINMNVFATNRLENITIVEPYYAARSTRAVTYADCVVKAYDPTSGNVPLFQSAQVRSFTATIANNLARAYTFQGDNGNNLYPQDIYSKQRDISGSIKLMGRNTGLAQLALNNINNCNAKSQLNWGFSVKGDCNAAFRIGLPGVIFSIEEMSMGTDIIESTVNWRSLPGSVFTSELGSEDFFIDQFSTVGF